MTDLFTNQSKYIWPNPGSAELNGSSASHFKAARVSRTGFSAAHAVQCFGCFFSIFNSFSHQALFSHPASPVRLCRDTSAHWTPSQSTSVWKYPLLKSNTILASADKSILCLWFTLSGCPQPSLPRQWPEEGCPRTGCFTGWQMSLGWSRPEQS